MASAAWHWPPWVHAETETVCGAAIRNRAAAPPSTTWMDWSMLSSCSTTAPAIARAVFALTGLRLFVYEFMCRQSIATLSTVRIVCLFGSGFFCVLFCCFWRQPCVSMSGRKSERPGRQHDQLRIDVAEEALPEKPHVTTYK